MDDVATKWQDATRLINIWKDGRDPQVTFELKTLLLSMEQDYQKCKKQEKDPIQLMTINMFVGVINRYLGQIACFDAIKKL